MSQMIKKITLYLLATFLLVTALNAQADDKEFSAKQKQEINQMIRAYILEHPEILPEAIGILQSRDRLSMLEKFHVPLFEDGFSYVGGNKNGDVTLVEFFDYNCGYCKKAFSVVERLKREDGNLRVIYKEFPILKESSYTAAKAAMASMKQGKYERFHAAMLLNSGNLTEERIFEIAREIGIDEKKLAKDMTSPILNRNIQINRSLAEALKITGTPGFVIGSEIIPGALPFEDLVELIEKVRQQAAKKVN